MNKDQIEGLKSRLASLEKERVAIIQLLEVWGENPPAEMSDGNRLTKIPPSFTTGGRIVDATVELIHKLGRPAKSSEIMEYIKEKQLPLGNTENPTQMLAAILANETKKKDARLKKAARGYFEIKQ
jgi:hypothetical protein